MMMEEKGVRVRGKEVWMRGREIGGLLDRRVGGVKGGMRGVGKWEVVKE